MNKVKVVFVGVGGMGQMAHLRNYAELPECEVSAIAEIRKDTAAKVAAKYAIPKVYADHKEMLEKEEFDCIVASQPFTRHGILIPELLSYGKPVFTEKPIAASVENGEKIVKAAEKYKALHMVGYHKRSDPAVMFAKSEIESLKKSKELGKMRYVRLLMPSGDWIAEGFFGLIKGNDPDLKLDFDAPASDMDETTNKEYRGFVNYYIHQVNLMRHLLGESYSVKYAEPSGVLFCGESRSGVACTIEMSPYSNTIDWQESALVCFEKGWIKIELPAPLASNRPGKVTIYKDPNYGITPVESTPALPWIHAMRSQASNFIKAVRGEIKPMCDGNEALEDIKIAREYIKLRFHK